MYYILNETNRVIAADDNLLELCGVSHIDELSLKIALGDITFDLSEENLTIINENSDTSFSMTKIPLSSMLGHLSLVQIQKETEKTQEDDLSIFTLDDTTKDITPIEEDSDLISIKSDVDLEDISEEPEIAEDDSDLISIKSDVDLEDISEEPEIAIDDNELFDLALEDETAESTDTVEDSFNVITEDTEILDLGLSDKEGEITYEEPIADDTSEIVIDIDKVCQKIGVSHEDYDTFLNEYIDTALGLEDDLQSTDNEKRSNAIATLSHLGEVLQLPIIGEIIAKIGTVSENKLKETVESFYAALSRITTSPSPQAEPEMELFEIKKEEETKKEEIAKEEIVKEEPAAKVKGFGTINLDDVKPKHFDFQLEEAANDLSLPVELIEEFVHDFIEQGHIETKRMLKAYEDGDLETIQKIGHLLKGASSNLRINALSDTLYKIQFCEDSNDLEKLIKDYWGHFLSFEIQINALAK